MTLFRSSFVTSLRVRVHIYILQHCHFFLMMAIEWLWERWQLLFEENGWTKTNEKHYKV